MPKFSFPSVHGFDVEDSIEGLWFYSLDVKKALIDSDTNEVVPLMTCVDSPLKLREEHSHSIPIDSKQSRNVLEREDAKIGL